jgi:4-hydroxy-tetrahydrodipicolinate synthase
MKSFSGIHVMSITPFDAQDRIDEVALRQHLRRMAAGGLGVYLAGPGVGEGHVLTLPELEQIYAIGAEELKGKVPVYAAGVEPRSARQLAEMMRLARDAKLDAFQIYGVDGGHAMRPMRAELDQYYDDAIGAAGMPVFLSTHAALGYELPVELMGALVKRHDNIIGINCQQPSVGYLVRLIDAVSPQAKVCTGGFWDTLTTLGAGGAGCLALEPNLVPSLCNSVGLDFQSGNADRAAQSFRKVVRLAVILTRFPPLATRALKLAMKILDLPGGAYIRRPYLMPGAEEERALAADLEAIGLTRGSAILN